MTIDRALLDEIGPWSRVKHDIIRRYGAEYSKILSNQVSKGGIRSYAYVDAFAGAGTHVEKGTGILVPGSARLALDTQPPFPEYYFIDIDSVKAEELGRMADERPEVEVMPGDCNRLLLDEVFPRLRWEDRKRALCLLDPYRLQLRWDVVAAAGQMRSIEIFVNFPILDINRNVLGRGGPKSERKAVEMTRFWGDDSWRESLYGKDFQLGLFGDERTAQKRSNDHVAEQYRQRLQRVAGFKCVPQPLPLMNSVNGTLYYLFFASANATGQRIVEHIFEKYRAGGF